MGRAQKAMPSLDAMRFLACSVSGSLCTAAWLGAGGVHGCQSEPESHERVNKGESASALSA